MDITWTSKDYGREGELRHLNDIRNNPLKHPNDRKRADKAHRAIVEQLKDKKLMNMRLRLIKAAQAGDFIEQDKISAAMKAYQGQDRETGL